MLKRFFVVALIRLFHLLDAAQSSIVTTYWLAIIKAVRVIHAAGAPGLAEKLAVLSGLRAKLEQALRTAPSTSR